MFLAKPVMLEVDGIFLPLFISLYQNNKSLKGAFAREYFSCG